MESRSVMSDSLQPQWTVAHQAPLSMGFSRQEYWSGLPFFSPRDLPDPGIEPRFPALQADICVCVWREAGLNFSLLLIFKLKDNCFTKFCCAGRFFYHLSHQGSTIDGGCPPQCQGSATATPLGMHAMDKSRARGMVFITHDTGQDPTVKLSILH